MNEDNNREQSQTENKSKPSSDLSAFSLAAALEEHRTQPRRIVNQFTPLHKRPPSQQSIATNASFATAHESVINDITPAVSYFADSSDDETDQDLTFGNDPLAVLSTSQSNTFANNPEVQISKTKNAPSEITFSYNYPEETIIFTDEEDIIATTTTTTTTSTMAKKTSKKTNSTSPDSTPVPVTPTETVPETKPTASEIAPPATTTTSTAVATTTESEPHFDVAQQVYSTTKSVWAWGKTLPIVSNILGFTEHITTQVLDKTVHMDLVTIDDKIATPKLKQLDDELVTPVILAVWKIIGPAVHKGEEIVVKPVMKEIVPRILGPLGMDKKKTEEEKAKTDKVVIEKKTLDEGPNPEYTSAPMVQ